MEKNIQKLGNGPYGIDLSGYHLEINLEALALQKTIRNNPNEFMKTAFMKCGISFPNLLKLAKMYVAIYDPESDEFPEMVANHSSKGILDQLDTETDVPHTQAREFALIFFICFMAAQPTPSNNPYEGKSELELRPEFKSIYSTALPF